ncbi:MAG TPA: hypothetical protein VGJ09_05350 [Bryobacteraceae bacterium]
MKLSRWLFAGWLLYWVATLIGQTGREANRQDYDAWREAHANLERDAGAGGTALVAQSDRAAALAAAFGANRAAYVKSAAQSVSQQRSFLQVPITRPSANLAPQTLAALVTNQLQTVTRTVARFASDKDRGIQQLRLSLEREREALEALNESMDDRQKAAAKIAEAGAALEQARAQTAEAFGAATSALSQNAAALEKENAAWAAYYEKLAQAIQVANAPPPRVEITAVQPRNEPVPGIPRARFVGAWTFPISNGIYHGAQPEFVDLVVHEINGHADGTLFGRFKPASGSAADPLVRFDFQGEFGASPTQRFALITSDGTAGTIELIPGPAFNLLEVNFQADPRPGKISVGNFILVKK